MARIRIRFPLPHESSNDYEAIGRFVSMGVHVERMLQYCLYSADLTSASELYSMRLYDKIETLNRLIFDERFVLHEFESLPAKLHDWRKVRNRYAHGMTTGIARNSSDALNGAPILITTRLSPAERVEAESLVVVLFECCRRIADYISARHLNPGMIPRWPNDDFAAEFASHDDDPVDGEFF